MKEGDAFLGDAAAIACGDRIYVVRKGGSLTTYGDGAGKAAPQSKISYTRLGPVRPSRLATAPGTPLYVVERDNNRVLAVDAATHSTKQFLFPRGSDLRGILPFKDGFWILNKGMFEHRLLSQGRQQ